MFNPEQKCVNSTIFKQNFSALKLFNAFKSPILVVSAQG